MRVLVTGASGLLGGGVARALAERGDDVTVFQRRPSGLPVREVLGDVTDADAVRGAAARVDAVVHLAARVSMTGAWALFEAANVRGTAHVVEAARGAGASRFVQVSSPSVAHAGRSLVGAPAGPADPEHARGPYARSKARAERLALAADAPGFAVVAVRPHLVWGPGDTQLVGPIVERARRGRLALVGGGTALIDTTYLDNAVAAIVAGLDRADDAHGQALVVSNGEPRTVRETVARICAAAGVPAPRRSVPFPVARAAGAAAEAAWRLLRRTDEPPMTRFLAEQLATAHWFDQRRTREALGWQPTVSLDEGFERLASWYRSGAR
ncbi:MAG TPA: NAD-dependent epimerase/dehydratase family protein [Actinomycetes bacterium]